MKALGTRDQGEGAVGNAEGEDGDSTPHLCNTVNAHCSVRGRFRFTSVNGQHLIHINGTPVIPYFPSKSCVPYEDFK